MNPKTLERRFSFERVALLLRNRFLEEAPVFGIGAAIVLGINALALALARAAPFNHMADWRANGNPMQGSAWAFTIVLAGIILSSLALKSFHGRDSTDRILLPATPIEKYAAAFLDCVAIFPVAAAAAGMALSALLYLVERALGGDGGAIWTAWRPSALAAWGNYAAAATVFLAGSATFRKAAWLKTLGLALAYCLVASLAVVALINLFGVHDLDFNYSTGFMRMNIASNGIGLNEAAAKAVRTGGDVLFKAVIPVFAVLFGAARVAEKEGRDEVQ
jgi:hypothetical protein